MGQEICVLIIPGHKSMGEKIVHFFEDEATIIPVNPKLYRGHAPNLQYFFEHIMKSADIHQALASCERIHAFEDEGETFYLNLSPLAELIKQAGADHFILRFYTEIFDHSDDELYLVVHNGKVIRDASNYHIYGTFNADSWNTYDRFREYEKIFGVKISWMANEKRYFTYRHAREEYFANSK